MFRNYSNYNVYADGRIFSYYTNKFLKPQTNKNGYKRVCLVDNEGNAKWYQLHRVVWESVTREPIPKDYEINHISEAKDENFVENLELISHKQNCNFGTRNKRIAKAQINGVLSKSVGAFKDGKLIMEFPSTNEAQRQGFKKSHISECCNGKKKTHRGFEWRYI